MVTHGMPRRSRRWAISCAGIASGKEAASRSTAGGKLIGRPNARATLRTSTRASPARPNTSRIIPSGFIAGSFHGNSCTTTLSPRRAPLASSLATYTSRTKCSSSGTTKNAWRLSSSVPTIVVVLRSSTSTISPSRRSCSLRRRERTGLANKATATLSPCSAVDMNRSAINTSSSVPSMVTKPKPRLVVLSVPTTLLVGAFLCALR